MKNKTLLVLLIWGWFFAMQAPDAEVQNVFSTILTGPYSSEAQCRHYQEQAEETLKQLIPGIEFKKCFFMEKA